jgi:hypothetical protein
MAAELTKLASWMASGRFMVLFSFVPTFQSHQPPDAIYFALTTSAFLVPKFQAPPGCEALVFRSSAMQDQFGGRVFQGFAGNLYLTRRSPV